MLDYPEYRATAPEAARAFIATQRAGRLITAGTHGHPRLGLYVFILDGPAVEVHLVREDPQVADIHANPRVLFEVDEVLSSIPSHWTDERDATHADQYYRCAMVEATASIIVDPAEVTRHLRLLLGRYQPEGRHADVTLDDPRYQAGIARLVVIRMPVTEVKTKFKLGQKLTQAERAGIRNQLAGRGRPEDRETLRAIEDLS